MWAVNRLLAANESQCHHAADLHDRYPSGGAPSGADAPSPWRRGRKRPRDRSVKREAVIRAAARAFNARGYHNTSLDDIAAALEVTKPTIYYYVANKEQLLFECFCAGLEQIRAAFRGMRARAPAGARAAAMQCCGTTPRPSPPSSAGAWCAPRTRT